ncbi:MAG TPA: diacylglycerol kinase family protein [Thermomicrobiales bacterium]|nr:diacylglycerol kinase family protein [Thermomicrobiales bacterium]
MTARFDESSRAGTQRQIRVLVNPNSGVKAGIPTNTAAEEEVRIAVEQYFPGLGEDIVVTEAEEEAIAATRDAVARGYQIVVAAGGDGTVGTVACELLGKETALGILPLGSVMNVARMLDIPRDLEGAAAIIATGEVRTIDVGEAKGQIFFEGGSVGLNAAVFREAQQADSGRGRYRALLAALWVLLRYRPPRMVLHLDDRVLTTRALAVSVANGPYSGLGFTVSPDATPDDGKFDVVIFSRFSRTELIRHFVSIAFGRRQYSAKTATYRTSRVRIEGVHPLPCRADGHDLGYTPVEYALRPGALRVVAPRSAT